MIMNESKIKLTQDDTIKGCSFLIVACIALFFLLRSCMGCGEEKEIPLTPQQIRKKEIQKCFSGWDGSHIELTKIIKSSMNDIDSYSHVKTVYYDKDSVLLVETTFRGKNAFGGTIKQTISAMTDIETCIVLEIIE